MTTTTPIRSRMSWLRRILLSNGWRALFQNIEQLRVIDSQSKPSDRYAPE